MLAVFILKVPELGTASIGESLEWLFYVTLPNFCFSKALQDLSLNHQLSKICSELDEYVDRTEFCEQIGGKDRTNPCCPGELSNVIYLSSCKWAILRLFVVCTAYIYVKLDTSFFSRYFNRTMILILLSLSLLPPLPMSLPSSSPPAIMQMMMVYRFVGITTSVPALQLLTVVRSCHAHSPPFFRPRLPCSYLAKSRPQPCWLLICDVISVILTC